MKKLILLLEFIFATNFLAQSNPFTKFVPYSSIIDSLIIEENNYSIKDLGKEQPARWLSTDPLADKYPGWSPYNYCLNNPVNLVDPDGRWIPEYDKADNNKIIAKYQDKDTYEDLYTQLGMTGEEFANLYQVDLFKGISTDVSFDITGYALKNSDFSEDNLNMNCYTSVLYGSGATNEEMYVGGGFQFTEEAVNILGYNKVDQQTIGTVTTWKDENNTTHHAAIYLLKGQDGTQYFIGREGPKSNVAIQSSKTINSIYPDFQKTYLKYSSSKPQF